MTFLTSELQTSPDVSRYQASDVSPDVPHVRDELASGRDEGKHYKVVPCMLCFELF
jgi:hypothetical protein